MGIVAATNVMITFGVGCAVGTIAGDTNRNPRNHRLEPTVPTV
jgi:hypothetical protein